jgi:hypothetical protein
VEAELLFITAYIIAQRFRFVNSFFEKIRKNLKWLFSFQSLLFLFFTTTFAPLCKVHKNTYDKEGENSQRYTFHQKIRRKIVQNGYLQNEGGGV